MKSPFTLIFGSLLPDRSWVRVYNPKAYLLVLSLSKDVWRLKAWFDRLTTNG